MPITIEQQHDHHHQLSLISWLTHITHNHHNHHDHHTSKSKTHIRIPAIKQEKETVSSTTPVSDDKQLLTCSVTVKHTQPLHPKKHHYFYRHHKKDDNDDTSDTTTNNSSSDKQHTCKCCEGHRRPSSVNDADDEMSPDPSIKYEKNYDSNSNVRSGSSSSGSTASTLTNNTNNSNEEEHRKSFLSIDSRNSSISTNGIDMKRQREKSIHTLPEDIDDPSGGYKSLKEDGGLIDYDSSGFEADDEGSSEVTKDIYNSTKVIIKHDLVKLALNGLFCSPIHDESKKQVLHVGCGDGSWCVDVAQLHPDWLVIGLDDKTGGPIQDHRKVPRNFKYVRCYYDTLKTLQDMPELSFDLVYGRFLIYSYGEEDYGRLVSECKRICKKGGYVELVELDMNIYGNPVPGPITRTVTENVFHAMEERKLTPVLAPKIGDILLKAFSAKDEDKTLDTGYTSLPLGLWGGRMGVLFRDDINELFHVLELYTELQHEEKYGNKDDTDNNINGGGDDDDTEDTLDSSSVISHSVEVMDEELEACKAFMNLHHAYIQKTAE